MRSPSKIGVRYSRLVVLNFAEKIKGRSYYLCICDCGKETKVSDCHLTTGHTTSCGCFHKERLSEEMKRSRVKMGHKDLGPLVEGSKFGRLTSVKEAGRNKYSYLLAEYLCECGVKKICLRTHVEISKNIKSCGCLSRETSSEKMKAYLRNYRANAGVDENTTMGTENEVERGKFWNTIGKTIRGRDKNICALCNTKSRNTEVHHIESWSKNKELRFDPKNLITLCKNCHYAKAHAFNRKGFCDPVIADKLKNYVLSNFYSEVLTDPI